MDLTEYRASALERQRSADLLNLMPKSGQKALDIGARDGHFSMLMAERFGEVTALDLTEPTISHPKIRCIQGNAAALEFKDEEFDFVFCAEVLEHVPSDILPQVCKEIERVARSQIVIGVPFQQDIRVGRTTCQSCKQINPPWGHVNSFTEDYIQHLFGNCRIDRASFVGTNSSRTNAVSTLLMDFAGNPYGTYNQEERCIHCGKQLTSPPKRTLPQLLATKLAFWSRNATELLAQPHANWIHVALTKKAAG